MRKEYEKPIVEVVDLEAKEELAYNGSFDIVSIADPSALLLEDEE